MNTYHDIPPNALIREYALDRGWGVAELGAALLLTQYEVGRLLRGERRISDDDGETPLAEKLAKAFGTTPRFWTDLDRQFA